MISLHSQYVRRYRPKISCMQFPFVLSSSGIGKDPEMSPEQVLLWQWSTLQRLLSYSWLRKLFSTVWCSRWHSHGYFQTQTSCPHGAQLCCCTTLHGIIAMRSLSVLCQQFFCPNLIWSLYYNCMTSSSFPKFFILEFCWAFCFTCYQSSIALWFLIPCEFISLC